MITYHHNNFGQGTNHWVERDGQMIATIHKHAAWLKLPDKWSVNWMSGRVDWHGTFAEAKDNAIKGN